MAQPLLVLPSTALATAQSFCEKSAVAFVNAVGAQDELISAVLEAVGFYDRYAEAVRRVIPGYDREWKSKIVLPSLLAREGFRLFSVVAQKPDGTTIKGRLPLDARRDELAEAGRPHERSLVARVVIGRHHGVAAGVQHRLDSLASQSAERCIA